MVRKPTRRYRSVKHVLLINGSPRKKWNSATLLEHAAEGALSAGAGVETVHLHDLTYKGCVSCFACKMNGGKSYGKCAQRDELAPLLDKVAAADALIIASPVYFGGFPGEVASFAERVLCPNLIYTNPLSSIFPGTKKTGLIFSMNVPSKEVLNAIGQSVTLKDIENRFALIYGSAESLYVMNTTQFEDYDKVTFDFMPVSEIERTRREVFPLDCDKAFNLGARLAV